MSRQATAELNYQLTTFAQGHMNDRLRTQELAERLCPAVQVPGTNGQYKSFDDKNSFQVYDTTRAMGGDPTRMEFSAKDGFFNCKPHALEVTVDKEEDRQVGEDNALAQQLLDEGKIRALLNVNALSLAKRRVDFVLSKLTAEAGYGEFSNPDIDPIEQIDELVDKLSIACGSDEFIRITMSRTAWRTIRNHPKSKARVQGVQTRPLNLGEFVDILATPIDTRVFSISYNEAPLGKAQSKKRLLSGDIIIHYGVTEPTEYDPSAFKTFTAGNGNIMAVRTWYAQNGLYRGHLVDWSEDMAQTSTIAAKRIKLT